MRAREFLASVRSKARVVARKRELVESLRADIVYVSPAFGPAPHRPMAGKSSGMARLLDMERDLEAEILGWHEDRRRAMEMVDSLPSATMAEVFYRRYLQGQKWEEIATAMRVTPQWVGRLHKRGLAILDGEEKGAPHPRAGS